MNNTNTTIINNNNNNNSNNKNNNNDNNSNNNNNNNNNNNSNNSLSMSWGKSGNPIHDINKQNINRNEAVVFFDVSLVDFCYALTH